MQPQHTATYHGPAYPPILGQPVYDNLNHLQYGPPYFHPPAPQQHQQYPAHPSYPRFFSGEHRDILDRLDTRDLDVQQFLNNNSMHQQLPPPPPHPPPPQGPVHTSDPYPSQSSSLSASAMLPFRTYWSPEPVPSPPSGPLGASVMPRQPPAPGLARGMSADQPPFDEEQARVHASLVFDRFDHENVGYLDLQEFMDALRALHLSISYHNAIEAFFRADVNRDGRVSRDEFLKLYIYESMNLSS